MGETKTGKPCRVPAISRPRILLRIFLNFSVASVALLVIITFFPVFGSLNEGYDAIWLVLILAALQIVLWPLLIQIFLQFFSKIPSAVLLIIFPIIYLLVPATLIEVAGWISPGLEINGFGPALVIAFVLTVISSIFSSLFYSDDELAIFRWILSKN